MNITELSKKSILELIRIHKGLSEDDPRKHELDCMILSKMKSKDETLSTYICSLGGSNLEEISLMDIENILKDIDGEKLDFLLQKVERLQEVLLKYV